MKPTKRLFDGICSLIGLIVLVVPLAVVGVIIKLTSRGPVLFKQERIGYRGKPFLLWKFRTMRHDADDGGPKITVGEDPRITTIGRWLRKFKFDELPQLINVLKGDVSLVGPRPEVAEYVDRYTDDQRAVLELVPGITDPASIKYRNEAELLAGRDDPMRAYVDEIMPDKIRINLEYARSATPWSDLGVIIRTVLPMIG